MTRVLLRAALLAALVVLAGARDLSAQCITGATHVSWPAVNPVWDFCFRSPSKSPGANGSGL
jgi:hypothetical protein